MRRHGWWWLLMLAGCGQGFADVRGSGGADGGAGDSHTLSTCTAFAPSSTVAYVDPQLTAWDQLIATAPDGTRLQLDVYGPTAGPAAQPGNALGTDPNTCTLCLQGQTAGTTWHVLSGTAVVQATPMNFRAALHGVVLQNATGETRCLADVTLQTTPTNWPCSVLNIPTTGQVCWQNARTQDNKAVTCQPNGFVDTVKDCKAASQTCTVAAPGDADCTKP